MHANDISPLYLLFAGHHGESTRGAGTIVAAFSSKEEARAAFLEVRFQLANRDGWAELAAVSSNRPAKRLGWFGQNEPRAVASAPARGAASGAHASHRRWRVRRRTR